MGKIRIYIPIGIYLGEKLEFWLIDQCPVRWPRNQWKRNTSCAFAISNFFWWIVERGKKYPVSFFQFSSFDQHKARNIARAQGDQFLLLKKVVWNLLQLQLINSWQLLVTNSKPNTIGTGNNINDPRDGQSTVRLEEILLASTKVDGIRTSFLKLQIIQGRNYIMHNLSIPHDAVPKVHPKQTPILFLPTSAV